MIAEFADYRREQLEQGDFDFLRGTAAFIDKERSLVKSLDGIHGTINARSFLIATGSVISAPEIPGLADAGCMTSDEFSDLTSIPQSTIVLGAGPVALEIGPLPRCARVAPVTIVQRSAQLLKGMDQDVAKVVETIFRKRGMQIYTNTKLLRTERNEETRRVRFEHEGSERSR